MKQILRTIEVRIRQVIWALLRSFSPTSYDSVIFKGSRYYIKSSLIGDNFWDLYRVGTNEPIHRRINGNDFKLVHSFNRFINTFKFYYNFQKTNWGAIDRKNPIGFRLSYKNQNDIFFNL